MNSTKECITAIWWAIVIMIHIGVLSELITSVIDGMRKRHYIGIVIFIIEFIILTYYVWFV